MKLSILLLFVAAREVPSEKNHGYINGTSPRIGVSTLPTHPTARSVFQTLRAFFFYGEVEGRTGKYSVITENVQYWLTQLNNPPQFNITTKDGVRLNSRYIAHPGANRTLILFGGMLGGGEGMVRYAAWFKQNAGFNTIVVTRRGFSGSEGSSIDSGELGIFYDVQATLSYLVNERGINISSIWWYGYCLGGTYAITGASFFPQTAGVILDRAFPDSISNVARAWLVVPKILINGALFQFLFPQGIADDIAPKESIIEPDVPYETSGMSMVNMFNRYTLPGVFFLYGENDWIIPHYQTLAMFEAYTGVKNRDLEFYSNKSDIAMIHKGHLDFFMTDEEIAKTKLLKFINDQSV